MKNQLQIFGGIARWSRYVFLACMLTLQTAPVTMVYAQDAPGLSEVNDNLEDQTNEVLRLAKIICRILAIIATVLLLANLVFKKVEQSTAFTTWFLVLFVWGMLEIIF